MNDRSRPAEAASDEVIAATGSILPQADDSSSDITKVPLTTGEESRLQRLEDIVERGLDTFVQVGRALAAIRDGRLYRATHLRFADYVKDRFGLSPSFAYRQMDAAEVAAIVSPIGNIANEAQARELVGLEPDQARDAYRAAVEQTQGRPTAAAVRDAAARFRRDDGAGPSAPAPASHRKPLQEVVESKILKIEQMAEHLDRLTYDDRFRAHRVRIASSNVSSLDRAIKLLLIARMAVVDPTWTASEVEFESALKAARDDGDLSAENVARHLTLVPNE